MSNLIKELPTANDEGEQSQRESPLRRYLFSASRDVEGTQTSELSVIALSEQEAWEIAQAQVDDDELDWNEAENMDAGEAELSFDESEALTNQEIERYLAEQRSEDEQTRALQERATHLTDIHAILASVRTAASEDVRAGLLDELERIIR